MVPDAETADRLTPDDLDALCACLADSRRRVLMAHLSETSGPVAVESLVRHLSERAAGETARPPSDDGLIGVTMTLRHNHLPKLDEAKVVELDRESNSVRAGDHFDVATSLLEVV